MTKLLLLFLMITKPLYAQSSPPQIISIGGSISEIICALDHCSDIIAVDATSIYPPELSKLPQLGYYRQVNAENIYRLKGDNIIMLDSTGPAKEVDKLKELGASIQIISSEPNFAGAIERITKIGDILGESKKAKKLIQQLKKDLAMAKKLRQNLPENIKALFVYSRGKAKFLGAGKDTAAASMFALLKITNAYDGNGYKQLSSESLLAMNPDIIIFPRKGNDNFRYEDMKMRMPGLALTKAFKTKSFILVDDLKFMAFTHRFGQGAQELIRSIQELSWIN